MLRGLNSTIMAYGTTSSGKVYFEECIFALQFFSNSSNFFQFLHFFYSFFNRHIAWWGRNLILSSPTLMRWRSLNYLVIVVECMVKRGESSLDVFRSCSPPFPTNPTPTQSPFPWSKSTVKSSWFYISAIFQLTFWSIFVEWFMILSSFSK